ncbi:MAG: hypothetical protein OEZ36_06610 [Spirochaetota bacterium]|nr:hypothetical protein [Spirochaetota bacterium]
MKISRYFLVICIAGLIVSCEGQAKKPKPLTDKEKAELHMKKVLGETGKQSEYGLIIIMRDLARQIDRINTGLFTNNRYMIQKGAEAIAHHPIPKGGIKPYLRKNVDKVKTEIPIIDKNLHQTAIIISKKAKTASIRELHDLTVKMTSACVRCHQLFRD